MLVDRAVDIGPTAYDLNIRLVHEPAITCRVTGRARGVDEPRREGLQPPVDRDAIDLDTALGEQLLDIAVGQAVAQIPAYRHRNHLPWEPIAGWRRRGRPRSDHPISLP